MYKKVKNASKGVNIITNKIILCNNRPNWLIMLLFLNIHTVTDLLSTPGTCLLTHVDASLGMAL